MSTTYSVNFNMAKPDVGGSNGTWGTLWNSNLDIIDSQLKAAQTAAAAAQATGTAALPLIGGTLTGPLTAPRLNLDDQNYFAISNGSPVINFDATDYLIYTRATNTLSLAINATPVLGISPTAATLNLPLVLNVGGTAAAHATRKDYVDAADATRVSKSGDTISGDLTVIRPQAPTTGVVLLGNSGHYVFFDGTNYQMPGGQLFVNGSAVYHTGNLNPAIYAPLAGATFSGALRSSAQIVSQSNFFPTLTVWNIAIGAAAGLMMGGEGNLYLANMDGNGNYAGTWRGYIAANGDLVAQGNIIANSDRRLKTALAKIDDPLGKLMQITGYSYEKIATPGERHLGVIAQDVEAVFPEAVRTDPDGNLSVSYSGMIAPLVEAIKALTLRLAALEARLG